MTSRTFVLLPIASIGLYACGTGSPVGQTEQAIAVTATPDPSKHGAPVYTRRVCTGARVHCYAHIRTDPDGRIQSFALPTGYTPLDLASAYALNTGANPGATIAITGAYGYPNVESDLATYRAKFGYPPCTIASGCLQVLNQQGQSSPLPGPPPPSNDWTVENALDLDMASAACPNCKLMLLQADDDQGDGLFKVQQVAVQLGATVISNSWGGPEDPTQPATTTEFYFDHAGVETFNATGDNGYDDSGQGPDYPGTSAFVIGVGGTTLVRSLGSARGWKETAWNSGGSACSLSIPKPSWQTDGACQYKASSDVAAVGDPATGLAVFNKASGGWIGVGGTSASSPLVAGIFAVTGHGWDPVSFGYSNPSAFYDITSGTNGTCNNVLCNAGQGWDGPTGVGTPNGTVLASLCTPHCSGRQCGDDGCGGSCGTCSAPETCGGGGIPYQCGTGGCARLTECPAPFNCGEIPDGCGGTLWCGTCSHPQTCGGTKQANVCGCTPTSCEARGMNCGTLNDGCGKTLDCGTCPANLTCGAVDYNVCGCAPTTCSAQNATCGSISDGCGNNIDCGSCGKGDTCESNQCVKAPPHGCGYGSDGSPAAIAGYLGMLFATMRRRKRGS